ncbi:MAG: hypothetical protein KZQ95_19505 [Candidatus Thiodiazotropha sp. (ex Epidulcina cf. delphinae)]|nr:hypothetical protein [Candidatus Thiodiazotropha sp. (ex Epidulcina cf. delphinae)]MCU7928996.1 hypothetical protein [Candidatus Thiodiazotropha sp. (ex Dulcina madagascariensis)]
MARYKDYDKHQQKLIPVSFADQIHKGAFEHTLDYMFDNRHRRHPVITPNELAD